jgi:hypothetical protein
MDEKSFPSQCTVTVTAGQNAAWGIPRTTVNDMRGLTSAAETTLAMTRNLEELGQSLETLDRILQALDQRL